MHPFPSGREWMKCQIFSRLRASQTLQPVNPRLTKPHRAPLLLGERRMTVCADVVATWLERKPHVARFNLLRSERDQPNWGANNHTSFLTGSGKVGADLRQSNNFLRQLGWTPALGYAEFRLCSGCSHRGFGCERLQGADSGRSLLLCQFKERPKAEVRAFELKHTKRTNLTTSVVKKKSTIKWEGFKVST